MANIQQIQYQGQTEKRGFQVLDKGSAIPALQKELDRQQAGFKDAAAFDIRMTDKYNAVAASNEKFNAEQSAYNLRSLANLSKTLSDTLVEETKKRNAQQQEEGLNLAYMDGFSEQEIADFEAQEAELRVADEGIQQYADTVAKSGAPYMGVQRVRELSGWKAYGYAMGMATMAGQDYAVAMQQALADLPADAPVAEKVAALAQARGRFMSERGLVGLNPLLANKYAFPSMRQADSRMISEWRQAEENQARERATNEALEPFFANPVENFGSTIIALERAGLSKGEARDKLLELIQDPNAIDAISTQTSWDGKKTWGEKYPFIFRDARLKAMKRNQDNFSTYETELAQDKKQTLDGILSDLQANEYTNEQIDEIIKAWQTRYQTTEVPAELKNYRSNMTKQARDLFEQEQDILDKIASETLTTEELTNGQYSRDLVIKYRSTAQGIDKQHGAGGKVATASKYSIAAVENAVRLAIGETNRDSILPPSAQLAMASAMQQLESGAMKLKAANPNMSWEQAYSESAKGLVQEISSGVGLYQTNGKFGSEAAFTNFSQANVKAHNLTAIRTKEWSQAVDTKGEAVFTVDGGIFSKAEIELMANDKGADLSKLSLVVTQYNAKNPDKPLTLGGAKQMLLDSAGVQAKTPYKPDEYEETASTAGMMNLLTRPTPSRTNRVAAQGNLIPPQIRSGTAGGYDIINTAVALGMPAQIAPLAAMQWALESGWGRYSSGKNNFFGIKGPGTTVQTQEDYGNGLVTTSASFRDYNSPQESVRDYVELLQDPRYAAVLTAQTPAEALRAVKAAGYATDSNYVTKGLQIFKAMGINPNVPYQHQPLTASPWSNPALMGTAARKFITGNTGIGTGAHLDMRVYDPQTGGYVDPTNYQDLLTVDGGIPIRRKFAMTSGYGPRRAPVPGASTFHNGLDFATPVGTAISVRGGRFLRSYWDNGGGGVVTAYRLPDGRELRLLHGSKQNM